MILQSYLGAGEIGIIRAPRNIPPADEENLNVRPLYRVVEEEGIFGTGYGQDIEVLANLKKRVKFRVPLATQKINSQICPISNSPYFKDLLQSLKAKNHCNNSYESFLLTCWPFVSW